MIALECVRLVSGSGDGQSKITQAKGLWRSGAQRRDKPEFSRPWKEPGRLAGHGGDCAG